MSLTKLCGAFVLASAVLCVAIMLAHGARPAHAGGVVTECTDAGLTHALAGGGTVTFDCPVPGPYTIPITAAKTITAPTSIDGRGVIVLDGQNMTRHFTVPQGASLELHGLTLTRGAADNGGSINNRGVVTASDCALVDNHVSSTGGGIANFGGMLIIRRSLIAENSAYYKGGGIHNSGTVENPGSGNVLIEDSTVINNKATASGYYNGEGGGLFNYGAAFITNSTFISNSASWIGGGGVATSNHIVIINSTFNGNAPDNIVNSAYGAITNTIFAGGTSQNCNSSAFIGSNNLSSDASCAFTGAGSQINIDPQLGPLVYFGVGVPTYSLLPGSPAIDAGTNVGCPAADQRGFARPFGARCDIGAFEWTAPFPYAWYVPIMRR